MEASYKHTMKWNPYGCRDINNRDTIRQDDCVCVVSVYKVLYVYTCKTENKS